MFTLVCIQNFLLIMSLLLLFVLYICNNFFSNHHMVFVVDVLKYSVFVTDFMVKIKKRPSEVSTSKLDSSPSNCPAKMRKLEI